jgi:hypothetical protein
MLDGANWCSIFGIIVFTVAPIQDALAYTKACKMHKAKKVSRIKNFTQLVLDENIIKILFY